MNMHDATEQAYKKGYADGKRDAVKHGRWEEAEDDNELPWYTVYECSACGRRGAMWMGYCPNCGAKMDLPNIPEKTMEALEKMGRKAHGEE